VVISQRLDYLGVPFRCSRCRQAGHLKNECRLPFGVHTAEQSLEENVDNGYPMEVDTLEPGFL